MFLKINRKNYIIFFNINKNIEKIFLLLKITSFLGEKNTL